MGPPLTRPGIWPTKEELKGESQVDGVVEDPKGRENYTLAELHAGGIRQTFLEERDLDMVTGPLTAGSRRLWLWHSGLMPRTYGSH